MLTNIAREFAKLSDDEAVTETMDATSEPVLSASSLADIANQDLTAAKSNKNIKNKVIEQLSAAEEALNGDNSDLADLKRVLIAQSWSELEMPDRIESLAEQINNPNHKQMAFRYAGIGIIEPKYNPVEVFSQACESASSQSDAIAGTKMLASILDGISSLDEGDRFYLLDEIVKAYFQLLGQERASKE